MPSVRDMDRRVPSSKRGCRGGEGGGHAHDRLLSSFSACVQHGAANDSASAGPLRTALQALPCVARLSDEQVIANLQARGQGPRVSFLKTALGVEGGVRFGTALGYKISGH